MTVTNIDSVRPEVQSGHWHFDTEDEAQMFVAGVREDLAEQEFFDYVDHEVYQDESPYAGGWGARIDYIDRSPKTPEAA